jgi:hypothetical protein
MPTSCQHPSREAVQAVGDNKSSTSLTAQLGASVSPTATML